MSASLKTKFFRFALIGTTLLAVATIAIWMVLDDVASQPGFKSTIENAASNFLQRPLTIESLDWKRWPHSVLLGRNVRLWEDNRRQILLAEAPNVEARVELLSLLRLAVGITEMKFIKPRGTLRLGKDGMFNVERLVNDITNRSDETTRHVGALFFNWFVIEDGRLDIVDERRESKLFSAPLAVNGRGKLKIRGAKVRFLFDIALAETNSVSTGTVHVKGTLGTRLDINADASRIPIALLASYAPFTGGWRGDFDSHIELKKTRGSLGCTFDVATERLRRADGGTLPKIGVEGFYSERSTSTVTIVLESSSTIAHVSVKTASVERIAVAARGPRCDLMELAGWLLALKPGSKAGERDHAPMVEGDVDFDTVTFRGNIFTSVKGKINTNGGRAISVDPIQFGGLGGFVTGSARYDAAASTGSVTVDWKAANIDVARLIAMTGSAERVTGRCDIDGHLQSGAGDQFLNYLNGEIALDVRNGAFENEPSILKIISKLNLTSLFTEIKGDHRSQVPFDEAKGKIKIQNGKVSTEEPFVLQNPTLQMGFMGTIDLPNKSIDGRVVVNVLTVADEVIKSIPGLRAILLGDKKSFVPIWLEVKGELGDPKVSVMGLKSITMPIWNTIGHIFRLPGTLLKAITGKEDKE